MPFDGVSGGFARHRMAGPDLSGLAAAAASFDSPHCYLIAHGDRLEAARSVARKSALLQARIERCLCAITRAAGSKDLRSAIKREARELIVLAFGGIVYEGAFRQQIVRRVEDRLRVLCSLETWNPRPVIESFLDRAETAIAVALAYDWTYAELNVDLRIAVEQALLRHVLHPARKAYRDPSELWPRRKDNFTFVSNTGILIAALALLPRYREVCGDVLEQGFVSTWRAFEAFAPHGAWMEGPSYWSISVRHACLLIAALESSLGSSFGLVSRPGFSETGDFALHATGPFGAAFDFGDSACRFDPAALAWFAHRFKRPTDGWLAANYDGWHLPFTLLWADHPVAHPESIGTPTGKVFRGCDLACFRTTWSRSSAARPVFLAIKGGNIPKASSEASRAVDPPIHAQADAGTFIIDGARIRWVTDLGPDNYDLPGYFEHGTNQQPGRRWRYYRASTAGHNTLVINGANQLLNAAAPVLGSHVDAECKWVVFDLSPAYGEPPGTIRRGAALIGRHVIIQDEIAADFPGAALWVLHTGTDPVGMGTRIAQFQCGTDRFLVRILHPAGARMRLGTPPPAASFTPDPLSEFHGAGVRDDGRIWERERRDDGPGGGPSGRPIRRLEIAWPRGAERLTVLLSPDADGAPAAIQTAPLDMWLSGRLFKPVASALRTQRRSRHRIKSQSELGFPSTGLGRGPPLSERKFTATTRITDLNLGRQRMTIADYRSAIPATTGRILPFDTPRLTGSRHPLRAAGLQGVANASASQPISDASRSSLLLALIVASTVGMVASSIYVPSIPEIARSLDTSISAVQLTFVGYLAAFAVSMLVLGPLSDRYGRQPVMLFGLGLCLLSSVACACSPSIEFLIAARIAQGIGACAGMAVGRAAIRDVYGRDGAAPVLATLAFIVTLVQAFAPVLGGHLQEWVGWRSNFIFVALLGACALALAAKYVPETGGPRPAASEQGSMLSDYWSLLRVRTFLALALTATGAHAGFHVFAAGAPSVLIGTFGVPPEAYGIYAALPPMGFLLGSFLSNRLSRHLNIHRIIALGGAVLLVGGLSMVTFAALHYASPLSIVGPMIVICCGSGLVTPSAVAGGIGVSANAAGTASGLLSFMQIAGAAGATTVLSLCNTGSPLALALLIASLGALAMVAFARLMGRAGSA